jgi:hypothetical protein
VQNRSTASPAQTIAASGAMPERTAANSASTSLLTPTVIPPAQSTPSPESPIKRHLNNSRRDSAFANRKGSTIVERQTWEKLGKSRIATS